MNLNELRIGNYVCTSYMKKSVFRVNAIHSDRLYFESVIENFKSDTIPIYVEHIPLTEEWLLKAGFVKVGRLFYHKSFWACELSSNNELRFEDLDNLYVKHVHELQNLYFTLVGEELVFSSTEP